MKWIIASSPASEHIIPLQKYMFAKYAPKVSLHYISNCKPIDEWCTTIAKGLEDFEDEKIIFGLDDYIPTGKLILNPDSLKLLYDRCGFGVGDSRRFGRITPSVGGFVFYSKDTPYQCTCQFSIWYRERLIEVLKQHTTPWDFEVYGRCEAMAYADPKFTWVESGAVSRKWDGINIAGMQDADIKELIKEGLLKEEELIIYLGKGNYKKWTL